MKHIVFKFVLMALLATVSLYGTEAELDCDDTCSAVTDYAEIDSTGACHCLTPNDIEGGEYRVPPDMLKQIYPDAFQTEE